MSESGIYLARYPTRGLSKQRRFTPNSKMQLATAFVPQEPSLTPEFHFPLQTISGRAPYPRFVNRFDSKEMLLVIDGSCINNGRHADDFAAPSAGCSFLFTGDSSMPKPLAPRSPGPTPTPTALPFLGIGSSDDSASAASVAFRLERQGPTGKSIDHTSMRAKLRAVIAALDFRAWDAEGWHRVVILTDLEYIVNGATLWLPGWVRRRWRKRAGYGRHPNRDLWEALQARIEDLAARDCAVSFWLVRHRAGEPQSRFILDAKNAAREAARRCPSHQEDHFTKLCGVMV